MAFYFEDQNAYQFEDRSPAPQDPNRYQCFHKNFPQFGRFPKEMRLKIWAKAAFIPRVIPIFCREVGILRSIDPIYGYGHPEEMIPFKFWSPVKLPPMLQVCSEAREEGLKYYRLTFGNEHSGIGLSLKIDPRIYVNFEVDTLANRGGFDGRSLLSFCKFPIKHLAVNIFEYEEYEKVPYTMMCDLDAVSHLRLETLTLVHAFHFDRRHIVEIEPILNVKEKIDNKPLVKQDSLDGLAWYLDEINAILDQVEKDVNARRDRNKKAGAIVEQSEDEAIHNSVWKRPVLSLGRVVQDQRPRDANGRYTDI